MWHGWARGDEDEDDDDDALIGETARLSLSPPSLCNGRVRGEGRRPYLTLRRTAVLIELFFEDVNNNWAFPS